MGCEDSKILKFSQHQKSNEAPFIIFAGFECLIEKTDGSKNNSEVHSQQKLVNIFHQVFQCLQCRHAKA